MTIELGILDRLQDLGKPWPRSETQFEEVVARDQPGGANLFLRRLFQKSTDEVMRPQIAMARQAIQPVQFEMFRKSRKPYKALQRRRLHLGDVPETQVIGNERHNLTRVIVGAAQSQSNHI